MSESQSPIPDRYAWVLKAVYQFGIPSAIAVFLVYTMVTSFDKKLTAVQENLQGHSIDSAYMIKNLQESKQFLLRICVNTAKTERDRNACFNVQP